MNVKSTITTILSIVCMMDITTNRTLLTCICWIDIRNLNACKFGFVFDKLSQSIKRPCMQAVVVKLFCNTTT